MIHQHIVDKLNAKMREHSDVPVFVWVIAGIAIVVLLTGRVL